jgi:hypothetical protein
VDDDLRWRVSIHEAGHCVAARLMGLPCGSATIVAPDPHAMFARDCGAPSIIALLSGAIAESLLLGDYDDVGVEVDWERASARPDALGCDGDDAELWWCYTASLLEEHRGLIERLATELFHAGWLSGYQIDALLAQYLCRS